MAAPLATEGRRMTKLDAGTPPALSRWQMISYCIYAVPLIATTAAISNFIPPYFSQTYGLSLAVIASSLVIIRAIDAICDPLIGIAIDRAHFRQKHRPWLLIALPLYLAAVGLLFLPVPSLVSAPYLVATGGAVYIAFTIGMVVHQAWAAALTQEPRTLSRLFGFREIGVIAGVLGVFALAAIASHFYAGDIAAQARAAGLFILVAVTLATIITYAFTPDPVRHGHAHRRTSLAELRPFLLSRDFVLICLAVLVSNSGWTASATMGFFVAAHLYGAPQYFALALALTFAVAPLGMALWMRLAHRLGDRRALRIGAIYLAVMAMLLPFTSRLGAPGLFLMQTLAGIGFGAGPYLLRSLTGFLANGFVASSGREVRGAAFAMTNFFDKFGSGVGASALLPLAWLGFDPQHADGAAAAHVLLLVATAAPATFFALTAILVQLMRVDVPAAWQLASD